MRLKLIAKSDDEALYQFGESVIIITAYCPTYRYWRFYENSYFTDEEKIKICADFAQYKPDVLYAYITDIHTEHTIDRVIIDRLMASFDSVISSLDKLYDKIQN